MMNKSIKRILREYVETDISAFEKKALKLLHSKGFKPLDAAGVNSFLSDELYVTGFDKIEIYNLYKDYYDVNGDYENISKVSKIEPPDVKKVKTANIRARDLVQSKLPFKGSNTHAEYSNGVYVVFSYDWYPIYVHKDGQWYMNGEGYSMSTKKQMSQLRPYDQGDIIKKSKDELWVIIRS